MKKISSFLVYLVGFISIGFAVVFLIQYLGFFNTLMVFLLEVVGVCLIVNNMFSDEE